MSKSVIYKPDDFSEAKHNLRGISICISTDGFSFTCCKPEVREMFAFMYEPISLQNVSMLEYKIESIFMENTWLTRPNYSAIKVLIEDKAATPVPEAFFSEKTLDKYLCSSGDMELKYSKIDGKPLYVVYESYSWLEPLLGRYFKYNELQFKHILSSLTDRTETSKKKIVVSCHIAPTRAYMCAMRGKGELLNYSSVDVSSKEDILYYLLKLIHSIPISPDDLSVNFSGVLDSDFINFFKKNLRGLELLVCKDGVVWNAKYDKDYRTEHYNLLKFCQCGL
ncbi:MAG: DUF3822 family protein [Bacteroidales bacterium]